MRHRRMGNSLVGMGLGNLMAIPLIGASASMANTIPAGTAKTLAGTAVGMQGVALLGHNAGYAKKMFKSNKSKGRFY